MEETKDMRMAEWREALRKAKTAKERTSTPRVKMPELAADYRVTCNEEVNQGLTVEMAMAEASRCLDCANPQCVTGCPVGIDIPGFIKNRGSPCDKKDQRASGSLRTRLPPGKAV